MNYFKAINDILYKILRAVIMILLPIMSIMVFSQVVGRFTGISMAWSEELSIYCFSWLTYLGAAVILRNDGHIAVTSAVDLIKNALFKKITLILAQVFIMIFVTTTAYKSIGLVSILYDNDLRATNMEFLKMAYVFIQVPVCYFVIGMFSVEKLIGIISQKNEAVESV